MGKKIGRPLIPINWEQCSYLCQIHCTKKEIADFFNCSEDTLENAVKRDHKVTFSVYWHQHAVLGKMSLRRKQFEIALRGEPSMLRYLGKQYLGQVEDPDPKSKGDPDEKPTEPLMPAMTKAQAEQLLNARMNVERKPNTNKEDDDE